MIIHIFWKADTEVLALASKTDSINKFLRQVRLDTPESIKFFEMCRVVKTQIHVAFYECNYPNAERSAFKSRTDFAIRLPRSKEPSVHVQGGSCSLATEKILRQNS